MSLKPKISLLWALALGSLLPACATSINGRLVDQSGNPVTPEGGHVNVTRVDPAPAVFQTVPLQKDGTFEVKDSSSGTFVFEVIAGGIETKTMMIDLGDAERKVDLQVRKTDHAKLETIRPNKEVAPNQGQGDALIQPPKF